MLDTCSASFHSSLTLSAQPRSLIIIIFYNVLAKANMGSSKSHTRLPPPARITARSKISKSFKHDDGCRLFRLRLTASLLSHTPILIRNIRAESIDAPGLRPHEVSYLRLLDRITNGTQIEINATGTQLRFVPGILVGGDIEHECPTTENRNNMNTAEKGSSDKDARSVGWYLEGLLPIAPFCKSPLTLTLMGITDGLTRSDPSPDYLSSSVLPLMQRFGVGADDNDYPLSIRVMKRGAAPLGGGVTRMYCPVVKEILPIDLTNVGKFKRIRGSVVSCKIPPSSAKRAAHAAKGLLHRLLPDVWIHTDCHSSRGRKKADYSMSPKHNSASSFASPGCGPSPGLAMCLTAQTTEGMVLCAETSLDVTSDARGRMLPEDLGHKAAALLLDEVRQGGCIDRGAQGIAFLLMCLGPEDATRIRVGTLTQYSVETLRLIKQAFGVEFKVTADEETGSILLSCLGSGYRNMAKAST